MPERTNIRILCDHLIEIMKQGLDLLVELDDETYASPSPELQLASIGDHYRHHLDYIAAFIRGAAEGRIDYDDRRRDQQIATRSDVASDATRQMIEWFGEFDAAPGEMVVLQRTCKGDGERPAICTRVEREVAFLISHSMHHFAIIALATRLKGKSHPEDLGVMPSTLLYQGEDQLMESAAE